jgi:hypothetical protein
VVHKLRHAGVENLWLTERGSCFGYNTLVVDSRSLPQMRGLGSPVIFDVTHSVQPRGGGKAPAPERSANSWHPWPGPPWHSGSTGCSWRSIQIRITPSTMGPTWCRWTGLNLCWSSSWQQLMALRTAMEGGLAPSGL